MVKTADERVDQLLRASDPADREPSTATLRLLLDDGITRAQQHRRRKKWLLAPAAVVAVLLGGITATGALPAFAETVQHFVAETGIFGDGAGPGGTASGKHYTEMDDSEWIDLTAPDFPRYAVGLMPSYVTLPATVDRARFASDIAHGLAGDNGTDHGAVMQVTGIRRSFEANAACVWYQTWHDAAHDGQSALAAQAAAQYDAAASWPEIVATDGGGVVASMHHVHALASAGKWAAARALLGIDCTRADVASVTR